MDMYTDVQSLQAEMGAAAELVAAEESIAFASEDLYLAIDAADPDKQTMAPQPPPRARQLLQQYTGEGLYAQPAPDLASKEWYDVEARKNNLHSEPWYFGAISRDKAERIVLEQPKGKFLVRVSIKKNRQSYAITVSMGKLQFMHISVTVEDGICISEGRKFANIREVVRFFASNAYKDIVMLTGAVEETKSTVVPKLPPRPPAKQRDGSDELPPTPPRRTAPPPPPEENIYLSPTMDFTSDHIYSSALSSDEEDDYLEPTTVAPGAPPSQPLARNNTIKQLPLPTRIDTWSAAEVQRWLKDCKLEAFKKPFYSNGVTGRELIAIKGSQFPKTRYSVAQTTAFDKALDEAKARQGEVKLQGTGQYAKSRTAPIGEELPPPPPPRASRT
eukprot:m.37907 g.37907  ORF g.37907 m.37907 type:complete len:388 (+) comp14601_c0_seq5:220-1383(+)